MQSQFVKFVGGVMIIWIAVKLLIEGAREDEIPEEAGSIWQAVWIIVIADLTMSLDNVLAVAGASGGNLFLLIFGLGLSIPLVVFASNFLSRLMDRYPVVIYIGAAILGRVGGEMMMTDPIVVRLWQPSKAFQYSVEAFFVIAVIAFGILWVRQKKASRGIKWNS
ncbi:MAG: YjbE family putative metal transport protein [Deltaproteobacteria bacterium]|nr:YjbE family putative metal transport protein [Deltaproteobacteria bacterium]